MLDIVLVTSIIVLALFLIIFLVFFIKALCCNDTSKYLMVLMGSSVLLNHQGAASDEIKGNTKGDSHDC
ncbi:hypothetical protein GCM10009111_03390 [Colwellia asteriadis]|uniref:Uncharacterized protein n=1 Tax=Colwellia asteriadis TaxID=517723 RepID=A0ABP3WBY7_9GAMM